MIFRLSSSKYQGGIFILLVVFFLLHSALTRAETIMPEPSEDPNEYYSIRLDHATIEKGYTVAAFDDALKLSLTPGILAEATPVEVVKLNEDMPEPWNLERVSRVYQFEFRNKAAYNDHVPFYIQFAYDREDNAYKQVFFYDKNYDTWRPLPTRDFPDERFVRSLIHLPYARIAVFSHPGTMTAGRASWYAYKGGNFAASPDFPKGSRLRVYNYDKSKFVDITVNDFGPERNIFPDRAIDLDKVAFAALAPVGAGVIDVQIEPLYVAPDRAGRVMGVEEMGAGRAPLVKAKSAIVYDQNNGRVIWSKNATTVRPVASLTKLVAMKVFLDTRPTLNKAVAYSDKDAEYNYEYCHPWESAKLALSDGETVTIEDLVYASLAGSANNTIETLVRVSGLKRDAFIAKMNETVHGWSATSTRFVEPTGLAPENVSSAADYAIITTEVLKHPIIQKASVMSEYRFTAVSSEKSYRVRNTNSLIRSGRFTFTGSKTGYLHEAGYCLMGRVPHGDNQLIVVTLGAEDRDDSFRETEELIRYGLGKLR